MKPKACRSGFQNHFIRNLVATICAMVLVPGDISLLARPLPTPLPAEGQESASLPADQLDSLVAPIALYPDPMLSQTLVASTYPLEIIQLQQWLEKNKDLKDQALADAVKKQDWDPSIQAMALLPEVVKYLADNIKWTTDLGNAFLAQQGDVMDAVQRMRKKAQDKGNLKSTEQQKVETKVIESKQIIVVEQANPEVIYVPSYNPTVVYGAPVYAYPPIAYPPVGYYAAGMAISFGVGLAMGAAWGGGWGYNSNWGGGNNNININNNNNFVRNSNRQNVSNSDGRQPQLAAQPAAPWGRSLWEPSDSQAVWRNNSRRFDGQSSAERPPEPESTRGRATSWRPRFDGKSRFGQSRPRFRRRDERSLVVATALPAATGRQSWFRRGCWQRGRQSRGWRRRRRRRPCR